MQRTLLIVDDNAINRTILRRILSEEYEILEAENGEIALAVLQETYERVSAIVLDIVMPVLDGYGVLEQMQADKRFSNIPAIVATSTSDAEAELKALSLGAMDFIIKPYNPALIKQRIENVINLRENAALVYAAKRDKLTGLYNREAFFEKAAEMIAEHEAGYYVLSCLDVDSFKVINDQYGSAKGDEVLRYVADVFSRGFGAVGGISCRIMADHFAALYPASFMEGGKCDEVWREASALDGSIQPVSISVGRYVVDDVSLPISAMYDRASIAKETIKGRFDAHVAVYDESMRKRLLFEQEIINDMKGALEQEQFEVWFQPQYNHSTGALLGAEALVRWQHPQRGLIFPGDFIPVFERNGFIYELDKYVWRKTCVFLRKWLNEGRAPLPVSVNISRYDIFRADLIEVIIGLIEQYDLPVDLLRLEITESAFAKSSKQIISIVKRLVDYGFTMEIDDFGSGYSSLNTLKDVPANVLKLDMRFLENDENSQRGGNILESVVRMAKWLGMSVIAEGVETIEQANYLRSIGCNYVQGYLYAKPMPYAEYETLASGIASVEPKLHALETVENLDNNAFWDPMSMDTLIFNSYVGCACIFEYRTGCIELLRATEKYAQLIGSVGMTVEDALRLDWANHMDEENMRLVADAVQQSVDTKDEVICEFLFRNLPGCPPMTYLRSTLRVIAIAGDRYLIYCKNENITPQREAERKEHVIAEQLQAIMHNINGGVSTFTLHDGQIRYYFINEHYHALYGYTKEQFARELPNGVLDLIHPDDRERVYRAIMDNETTNESVTAEFRAYKRDGQMIWVRFNGSLCRLEGVDKPVHIAVSVDITKEKEAERQILSLNENLQNLMNITPGGFARIRIYEDGTLQTVYVNEGMCKLRGMRLEEIIGIAHMDSMLSVHPDDVERIRSILREMLLTGESRTAKYRLRHGAESYVWVMVSARISRSETGEMYLNAYYTDLSEQEEKC